MYLSYFGLREPPFSITPDPRFLYMSARHREALAHLVYGVGEHGGFVQLTGEVGTGKTSICRCLLEQLPPNVDLALVLNPRLSPVELLAAVCDELRIPYPAGTTSSKELVDRLYRHLLDAHARGRRTVLIVDEAQNLAPEVLEEVRLLTNLETTREKLLQVILIGQPELTEILDQPKLRQLAQRVTARYHLEPLSCAETRAYIRHRLAVAGRGRSVFTEVALRMLHRRSRGIPRLINAVADRALLGAYTQERPQVDAGTVRRAAAEVLGQSGRARWPWRRIAAAALVAVAGGVGLLLLVPGELGQGEARREDVVAGPIAPSLVSPSPTALDAAPPDARRAVPRLGTLLRDDTLPATRSDALAELLGLWGVPVTATRVDCGSPPLGMLECFTTVGTLRKLRRLDLPAALELVGPSGTRRYAVLTALTPSEATFRFRDRSVTVPVSEVEAVWEGLFIVLWRPPPGPLPVRPGTRGPAADWLREQLARADGADLPVERGQPFDEALRQRVVAFQQARSLEPHGVVDRETAILLQGTERVSDVPRLSGGTP
ncbi:MAG TPA: AAA family ATPase [Methylomirabilota bacterium]|nr:AAA family ATPase [Methylomirabilota bacterium]